MSRISKRGEGRAWIVGRLYLACLARFVPRDIRARWLEEWRHELWRAARRRGRPASPVFDRHLLGAIGDARALRALRREREGRRLEAVWLELRSAAASVRAAPRFAAAAVIVFATGIASAATLLSVVDGVLLRALPLAEPERLVQVELHTRFTDTGSEFTTPRTAADTVDLWREHARAAAAIAVVHDAGFENIFYLTDRPVPERLRGALVSPNFFEVLGARPLIGSVFTESDSLAALAQSVVLGHGLWQRQFSADPDVIGREVRLNGGPFRVVGVLPPDFQYRLDRTGPLGAPVEVFAPVAVLAALPVLPGRANRLSSADGVYVRLAADVDLAAAASELDALRRQDSADPSGVESTLRLVSLKELLVRETRKPLIQLAAAVVLLLLLACLNIAGLQVVRSAERQRELATRAALGAGRARLMRQVAAEVMLLAGAGGLLAAPLTALAIDAVVGLAPPGTPRVAEVGVDPRALGLVMLITAGAGMIAAVVPSWHLLGRDSAEHFRPRSDGASSVRTGRLGSGLVAAQVALAAVLLVAGGLLVRSAEALTSVPLGMKIENVLAVDVYRPYGAPPDSVSEIAYFRELVAAASELPGVDAAALTSSPPFRARDYHYPEWRRRIVGPGYFELLGMRLLRGRGITDDDTAGGAEVAVVNATLARQQFGDADPLGRALGPPDDPGPIVVGVVADTRHVAVDTAPHPAVYVPLAQAPDPRLTLLVRTVGDPLPLTRALSERLGRIDREQPLANLTTVAASLRESEAVRSRAFHLRLVGFFALAATMMALLGVYSVVRHTAAARNHEFGVRVALGATSRNIAAIVVRQATLLGAVGGAVGLTGAVALSRLLDNLLYGVEPGDPLTMVIVGAVLASVVVLASLTPARAVLREDPSRALRSA